jgi:succinyl-CoA synthetase beta subunit
MKLIEAEGKALLASHGVVVPRSVLLDEGDVLPAFGMSGAAVKAQVLSGGRGKSGLVRLVDASAGSEGITSAVAGVRATLVERGLPAVVLVEEKLDIAREFYISFLISDRAHAPMMLFSVEGGIEIEAGAPPAQWIIDPLVGLLPHQVVAFFRDAGVTGAALGPLCRLAASLYRVFVAEDLELLEINPLVVTSRGRLVAADAKVVLDQCAASRHPARRFTVSRRLELAAMTPLEREADRLLFTFIDLPGSVALMSYGAGLGMMLVDLLGDAGLSAACFVDGSVTSIGNNTDERLRVVFKRAEDPAVKAILFYQNLGTRDIKPRVEAVLKVLDETPPPKPFYFGFVATYLAEKNMTAAEACRLVAARGYYASQEPRELVEMIRRDTAA